MPQLVSVTLVLVGLIHLLPLSGALGSERLRALYGVALEETSLVVLMRHRAVLFGLVGALMIEAALNVAHQWLALGIAFVSVASFLVIERGWGNAQLRRVARVDWFALVLVLLGACARWFSA